MSTVYGEDGRLYETITTGGNVEPEPSGKAKRPRLRLSKTQRAFQQRTLDDLGLSDEFGPSPYLVRVLGEALVDARSERKPMLVNWSQAVRDWFKRRQS